MYEANLKFYRSSIIIFSFARSSNRLLPLNLSPCFENKEGRCLKKWSIQLYMKSFVHSIIRLHRGGKGVYNRVNGGTVWKFIAFRKRNRLPQPPLDLVQLNDRNLDRFSITSPHGNTNGLLDKFPRLACFRLTWPRLLCRDPVSLPPIAWFPIPTEKSQPANWIIKGNSNSRTG